MATVSRKKKGSHDVTSKKNLRARRSKQGKRGRLEKKKDTSVEKNIINTKEGEGGPQIREKAVFWPASKRAKSAELTKGLPIQRKKESLLAGGGVRSKKKKEFCPKQPQKAPRKKNSALEAPESQHSRCPPEREMIFQGKKGGEGV